MLEILHEEGLKKMMQMANAEQHALLNFIQEEIKLSPELTQIFNTTVQEVTSLYTILPEWEMLISDKESSNQITLRMAILSHIVGSGATTEAVLKKTMSEIRTERLQHSTLN